MALQPLSRFARDASICRNRSTFFYEEQAYATEKMAAYPAPNDESTLDLRENKWLLRKRIHTATGNGVAAQALIASFALSPDSAYKLPVFYGVSSRSGQGHALCGIVRALRAPRSQCG